MWKTYRCGSIRIGLPGAYGQSVGPMVRWLGPGVPVRITTPNTERTVQQPAASAKGISIDVQPDVGGCLPRGAETTGRSARAMAVSMSGR